MSINLRNSNVWVLVQLSKTKISKKKWNYCYMDTDSLIVYIKTEDVVTKFCISKYQLNRTMQY